MAVRDRLMDTERDDAVALLKHDHEEVDSLLKEFEKEKNGSTRKSIALRICTALTVHAQIEEKVFYPAARQALGDEGKDLLDEADVEHATIKGLVKRIEGTSLGDDHYDAYVKVLGEYVKHHVEEEEEEIFPKLRGTSFDNEAVGAALVVQKQQLMNR